MTGVCMKLRQAIGRGSWLLAIAAALVVVDASAQANKSSTTGKKKLVCWTDNAGNTACGDAVPPQFASKERKIIDGAGRTVKVIPGALTAEQRAEMEAQAQRDAIAQREAERVAAHDRALTATYSAPEDIAALRDDRLSTIDTQIELAESALRRDSVSLAELRSRLPAPDSGKQPSVALVKNIEQFESTLAENQRSIAEMRRKRASLCTESARDIQRFQELKTGVVSYRSPCPPPGSLSPDAEKAVDLVAAQAFFDQYVELEIDFDPAYLDRYADDAELKTARVDAAGKTVIDKRKLSEWREEALKALPAAREKRDPPQYSEIKIEAGTEGRAMISGKRAAGRDQTPVAFYVLVKASGKDWRIVERWTEAAPAP